MFASSCGDGKPRGVVSQEKMQAVIWDLALAGEYVNGYVYYQNPAQNRAAINNDLLKEIYRVHNISKKEFDKSLDYYKKNPKLLMAILDSVVAKQNKRASPAEAEPAVESPPPSVIQSPAAVPTPVPTPLPKPADTAHRAIREL